MKERLFELIEQGRRGGNIGLSMGFEKLEGYMDGYLPGVSYLIAAASGVGKLSGGELSVEGIRKRGKYFECDDLSPSYGLVAY